MRLCFFSDAHLFQSYMEKYDPISDFEKSVDKAVRLKPDALVLAGDMFDYKKTTTTYLRHYEGEAYMMRIRELLTSTGVPIYAIRGNHEKAEVLKGLSQTVENFHYIENEWKQIGSIDCFFLETNYEIGGYNLPILNGAFAKLLQHDRNSKNCILVMHETLAPFDGALPEEIVEQLSQRFNWVFNGHMHVFGKSSYSNKKIITLPSLIPSRVVHGKYWMEKYLWGSEDDYSFEQRESPFGFVTFDTDIQEVKFHRVNPSRKTVEVSFDFSGISLEQARKRFRLILGEIDERSDNRELIILPTVSGELDFSPVFLEDIPQGFPDLFVADLRREQITRRPVALVGADSLTPIVSPEQLYEEMLSFDSDILKVVNEKSPVKIDQQTVRTTIRTILGEDSKIFEGSHQKITIMLRNFVEQVATILENEEGMKKPRNLVVHLEELVKKVKE